jgi:hypothetical protein
MKIMERAYVMNCRKMVAPLLALLLIAGASGAGTLASGNTTVNIVGVAGRKIDVKVDFLVEDLATYPPGQLPAGSSGVYVYEYILHNLSTSTVKIDLFSVAAELTASIDTIGTFGSAPAYNAFTEITEKDPSGQNQSAKFMFMKFTIPGGPTYGDGPLDIGADSYKLIFTSNYAPKIDGTAFVSGGTIGGTAIVPTPVPEPISALLLGIGGLAIARKRFA